MVVKCLAMGLYPGNVDPNKHKTFRETCYTLNRTLNGAYTKELIMALEWFLDVFEGKLEEVEKVDHKARLLITHITNTEKTYIIRKNERTDLRELAIHNVNIKLLKRIKHFLIEQYGTKYGSLSYLFNQAMELYVKVKKEFIELVKTNKNHDDSFVSDNNGQISSIDTNDIWKAFEVLNSKVDSLKDSIPATIESTVQSVFNVSSKVVKKVKKVKNAVVISVKTEDKLDKSRYILGNVMKWNEHGFTIMEYKRSLVKLKGQGDPRTIRGDLEMLEADNLIRKVRSGAHGIDTYEFVENNQYHKYNSDLAKKVLFKDFKEKFGNDLSFNLDDLNEFIFEKYDLFDAQSRKKRLNWLLAEGLVRRHDVNPRLFSIE